MVSNQGNCTNVGCFWLLPEGSLGFREVIGTVAAGFVPTQSRATTKVAPTYGINPLNSQSSLPELISADFAGIMGAESQMTMLLGRFATLPSRTNPKGVSDYV
jgi:hypothetical protein